MSVSYKGFKVLAGVKWVVTSSSITITCYPKKSDVPYKLTTKSWKNYCPTCHREGTLTGFGVGKLSNGRGKFGVEGGVGCLKCDADFCGVTGRDTYPGSKRKLTPAGSVSSVTASASSIAAAKCEITKAEAISKAETILKEGSKSKYKGTLTVPMLPKLKAEQYCELQLPKFMDNRQSQYWINSVKVDIDNQAMTAELLEEMPTPSQEYKSESKTSSTSNDIAIKAGSTIERTLMLKGKELGSIDKIFNWLRVHGDGGWSYTFYYDHWKNKDSCYSKDTAAMKTSWNNKKGNCVEFAWAFYTMCLGIGIKVRIMHGTALFGSTTYGHLWNTYNGKIYDCSSDSAKNYNADRTVI